MERGGSTRLPLPPTLAQWAFITLAASVLRGEISGEVGFGGVSVAGKLTGAAGRRGCAAPCSIGGGVRILAAIGWRFAVGVEAVVFAGWARCA